MSEISSVGTQGLSAPIERKLEEQVVRTQGLIEKDELLTDQDSAEVSQALRPESASVPLQAGEVLLQQGLVTAQILEQPFSPQLHNAASLAQSLLGLMQE